MKNLVILFAIALAASFLPASGEEYLSVYRAPQGDAVIEADSISGTSADIAAKGHVEGRYDFYTLLADSLFYKKEESFKAENVRFFTCSDKERPHISVGAGLVEAENVNGRYRISLKDISLKYRDKKLLSLPGYRYNYDPDGRKPLIALPVPGYGKDDGFTLKYSPVFIDRYHTYGYAALKYGTKSRFSFNAEIEHGFDGYLDISRYKTLQVNDTVKYVTDYSLTFGESPAAEKAPARLIGSLQAMYKHKMNTLDKETLLVYRMPQASLRYYFPPFGKTGGADRRALLAPSLLVSWCREKDEPQDKEKSIYYDDKYRSKVTAEAELPYTLGTFGGITVQPVVKGIYNRYEDKSTYRALACGVDLSRFYADNSFWTLRYLWAKEKGFTPFEFDSIAYEQGLIAAGQKNIGKYILGGWYAYNFNLKTAYRYGVALGYKTDCFWSGASYDFHDKKLKLCVGILGF